MRRFCALIFLFLYLYNIVGYLAVFSVIQYRIREEIKGMLKASVPETQLEYLSFHTASLQRGECAVQWIEDHEFRYHGQMFDIVRTVMSGDTTTFVCINDRQEEKLFAHLDSHVARQMANSSTPGKLDSFKDAFQDSLRTFTIPSHDLQCSSEIIDSATDKYISVALDVPFLPPRQISTT
ncbi:MAG: hypothetical protein HY961_13060 [Ignavibacteriae bacterium]|nr:hypothetical protein [Ignavibacteriota bacterium]